MITTDSETLLKDRVLEVLYQITDPELMVNIVDLGLIYHLKTDYAASSVTVYFTLTSIGCPMGEMIERNIQEALHKDFPGFSIGTHLVWQPAWSPEMISEVAKQELSMF